VSKYPPGNIEQEALPEAIVSGQEVESRRELEFHFLRWSDILEVQVLKHRT
jgi:hypothetical protein